ncbi:hypothetical protein VCHA53O466_50159 [Vibrio chagasii]|nr:hypothetical protein VCHA53O466_50159 [Vibrio chagasii]
MKPWYDIDNSNKSSRGICGIQYSYGRHPNFVLVLTMLAPSGFPWWTHYWSI